MRKTRVLELGRQPRGCQAAADGRGACLLLKCTGNLLWDRAVQVGGAAVQAEEGTLWSVEVWCLWGVFPRILLAAPERVTGLGEQWGGAVKAGGGSSFPEMAEKAVCWDSDQLPARDGACGQMVSAGPEKDNDLG